MAIEDAINILKSPNSTFRKILDSKEGLKFPFLIVLVSGIIAGVNSYYYKLSAIAHMKATYAKMGLDISTLGHLMHEPNLINQIARMIVLTLLSWILIGFIIFVFSRLFKGRSRFKGILTVTGYVQVVSIIGGIISVVIFIGLNQLMLDVIIQFIIGIWALVILIIGVREANKFSTLRALGAVILPFVIFVVIIVGLVIVLLTAKTGTLAGSISHPPVR